MYVCMCNLPPSTVCTAFRVCQVVSGWAPIRVRVRVVRVRLGFRVRVRVGVRVGIRVRVS